jgi:hypothetical protein
MNNKVDAKRLLIKNTGISTRTQFILKTLGVRTMDDLLLMYLLGTIPGVNTNINLYSFVTADMIYTEETDEEVRGLLSTYCGIEILDNVDSK